MNPPLPSAALALLLLATGDADAHGIVRREGPGLHIASSVTVPAGMELLFVGGTLPDVKKEADPAEGETGIPDTATQARSVLGKIEAELAAAGYAMSDIVKMDVYLVADPNKNNAIDVMGLMSAYLAYFDVGESGLPTRTTVQVAGLPVPGALVQIAVTAARAAPRHHE